MVKVQRRWLGGWGWDEMEMMKGMRGEGMSQVMVVEVWSGGREVVVRTQRMGEEGHCGNVEE